MRKLTPAEQRRLMRYAYRVDKDGTLRVYDNQRMGMVTFRRGARTIERKIIRYTETSGVAEIQNYLRGLIDGARYG